MTLEELETEVMVLKTIVKNHSKNIQYLLDTINKVLKETYESYNGLIESNNKTTDVLLEVREFLKAQRNHTITEIPTQEYPKDSIVLRYGIRGEKCIK